ncbi:hypothetical protein ACJ73_08992 [Blastomyces percursus]|uniref:Pirin N-terminal domain-containing protein n=1 Tax=Blastomyces percursus TaxID=1658174 RepID=A0A1J9PH96_9EURO|nr:hypothetical protein ACJ73_08992 [Blastomyces percursus]
MSIQRAIRTGFVAIDQAEGAGARVRSPFLLLDHFTIGSGAGFPDHPHRGQETITYLLSGGVDHEDFAGHKGTIGPGDLQFMTAVPGIMHAEMPHENPDGSPNVGMQLWVDLPEKLKMCGPLYRDLRAAEIPVADVHDGKVSVKVISRQSHGDSVRDLAYIPVWIFDITLGRSITFHNVVFDQAGDFVQASNVAEAKQDSRFTLIASQPLNQKIVQYGFVLNSQEQVQQAMMDFRNNSNGFERAKGWRSEIGKRMG